MNILNQIEKAEANNEHTEVVKIKARAMGSDSKLGAAYLTILEDIEAQHIINGSMTPDLINLRRAIDLEITKNLKIRGIL